jgi:hypothetical protein
MRPVDHIDNPRLSHQTDVAVNEIPSQHEHDAESHDEPVPRLPRRSLALPAARTKLSTCYPQSIASPVEVTSLAPLIAAPRMKALPAVL